MAGTTTITPVAGGATVNVAGSNYALVQSWTGSSPPLAPLPGQSIIGAGSVVAGSSVQLLFSIVTGSGGGPVTGIISHSRLSITYAATRTGGGGSNQLSLLGLTTTDNTSGTLVIDDVWLGVPLVADDGVSLFPTFADYVFARSGVFNASLTVSAVSLQLDYVDLVCTNVSPNNGAPAGGEIITLTFAPLGFGLNATDFIFSIEFGEGNFADMLTWTIIDPVTATIQVPPGLPGTVDLKFNWNGLVDWLSIKVNGYTYNSPGITGVRMDQCPVLVLVPYALAQSNALGVNQGPNIEIEAANVLVPALENAGIVDTVITPNGGTPGQGGPFPLGPDTPVPAGPNPPSWAIGAVAAPAPALPNTSVPKQWQLLRFDIKPRAEERA